MRFSCSRPPHSLRPVPDRAPESVLGASCRIRRCKWRKSRYRSEETGRLSSSRGQTPGSRSTPCVSTKRKLRRLTIGASEVVPAQRRRRGTAARGHASGSRSVPWVRTRRVLRHSTTDSLEADQNGAKTTTWGRNLSMSLIAYQICQIQLLESGLSRSS